jgi:hypothetical protein
MLILFNIFNLVRYQLYMVILFRFYVVKYMGGAWASTSA